MSSPFERLRIALGRIPATFAVAAFTAVVQLPVFNRTIVSLDEGQLAAIGHRLASGEVLYRDIYTGIFPGIYWLAEALFRLLGSDVLVLRWTQLAVNSVTAALLFALVRPLAPGPAAWLVPVGYWILLVVSFPVFTMLTYSSLSLVSALGALVFVRRYIDGARDRDGIAAGVLLGLATLFKQNFGLLSLVAVLGSALWCRREGRFAQTPAWRAFGVPILAGAAVALFASVRLLGSGAWPGFFEATFLTIFASQVEAFNQPLPPVFGPHPDGIFVFLYGPGALFGALMRGDPMVTSEVISWAVRLGYGSAYLALLLVPVLALGPARRGDCAAARVTARILLPFSALFFLGIFPSAIWSHLAVVYPPLLMVFAAAIPLVLSPLRRRSGAGAALVRGAGLVALLPLVVFTARIEFGIRAAFAEPLLLPAATVRVARREAGLYRAANDFLTDCAAEGEPVFVVPDMPLLYLSSGRRNPTPYDLVIPGDVRESVILERLKTSGVSCVVLNPAMYVQFAPFEELFPGLAAYLATEFETVRASRIGGSEWRFLRKPREGHAEAAS